MNPLFYFEFEVTPIDMGENYYVGAYGETCESAANKVLFVGLWITQSDTEDLIKNIRTCYQVTENEIETSEGS